MTELPLTLSDLGALAWAPSGFELGIIAFIALILFGSRLPTVARSIGKSMTEFKKGLRERDEDDDPKPPTRTDNGP